MSFASRRTCVVEDAVDLVLKDDNFHTLPWDPTAWRVGDVVLYQIEDNPEIQHVALIAEISPKVNEDGNFEILVISAWGDRGEYLHPWCHVPLTFGSPSEVVSQRFFV